jgi:mannose-6-phosphate isomerase
MSDATFRVFDWNRKGADGQPRPLHVAQAIESTDFERGPVNPLEPRRETTAAGNVRERLSHCPYFAVERWRLSAPESIGSADRFTILIGLNGGSTVEFQERSYPIESGQTLLLPASIGPCRVSPQNTGATILACVVP